MNRKTRLCAGCGTRYDAAAGCPRCDVQLGPSTEQIRCGYMDCNSTSTISLRVFSDGREGSGWLNVCQRHYEVESTRRAQANVASLGLPPKAIKPTQSYEQAQQRIAALRRWLSTNARGYKQPERIPGEDDEEIAA